MERYEKYKDSGVEWIGEVPEHWEVKRLKFICRLQSGNNIVSEQISDSGEFPVFGGNGLRGYFNAYTHEGAFILIGRQGAYCGNIKYANGKFWASEHAIVVSPIMEYENTYVGSLLEIMNLNQYSMSAAQPGLAVELIKNLNVLFPPLEEQIIISSYLDRKTTEIDQLIADKKRLITLYEEEKTALINQAVTKGINPEVKMKDSGIEWLGEVPEEWEVKKIGHCTSIVRGGSPRPSGDPRYFLGDFMPWITVKEVTNAIGKFVESTEEYLTEEGSKLSRIIQPETLLLSNSGATLGVPKISKIKGCINDGSVAFVSFKDFLSRDFLYYFFVSHTQIYREEMRGNGQPNLELVRKFYFAQSSYSR
jgi:type I restriction enzyme S subunit